ncbi:hypothetical protein [Periweissella cryptocerci]|uniref:hypothetical protein n=1 Tax=Periweissella cryptocerci TaxID=2506420 RepID=UPI001404B078|nr:hypothetical protein [Periweissella cryptocerci]
MNLGLPDENELAQRRAAQHNGTAKKSTRKEKFTAVTLIVFILLVLLYNFLSK